MPSNPEGERSYRWLTWAGGLLLGGLVLGVFHATHEAAWLLWDDDINLENNWRVQGLTWANVQWMFTDVSYTRRYLPLAWLDWAMEAQFFGLTPRSSHLGNVLLHVANTWLVFCLIRRVVKLWLAGVEAIDSVAITVAATIGAAIWAVHPLRVEVVAWASGRIYGQATFFLLLATLAYLNAAVRQVGERGRRRWLGLSVTAFGLSLLTYPLAMSFVGVIVVLDLFLLNRAKDFDRAGGVRAAVWIEKIPFVVVTIALLGVTLWARARAGGIWAPLPTLEQFPVEARVMQAIYVWGYYVWKPLLPLHLAPVYTTLVSFRAWDWPFVISAIGVVAVTVLLFAQRRRAPGRWALWLIHLVLLVPLLGLTERPHYTNDRYGHLPGVLWSIALAVGLAQAWRAKAWRGAVAVLAVVGIAASSLASARQAGTWRDNETFFRHLLRELGDDPYRADIAMRLGDVLRIQGRLAEAETQLHESLRLRPNSAWAQLTLARTLEDAGRVDEAVQHYVLALRLQGDLAVAHAQLGAILLRANRAELAVAHLAAAARLVPDDWLVQANYGQALLAAGRVEEARKSFERALQLNPDFAAARDALQKLPR